MCVLKKDAKTLEAFKTLKTPLRRTVHPPILFYPKIWKYQKKSVYLQRI